MGIIPAPGVRRLSELEIDNDKDWNEKRIHNVKKVEMSELRLIPKASSTGAEGTIFYDSDDDHVYVATE